MQYKIDCSHFKANTDLNITGLTLNTKLYTTLNLLHNSDLIIICHKVIG